MFTFSISFLRTTERLVCVCFVTSIEVSTTSNLGRVSFTKCGEVQ